jgi:hypothetical protein
MNGLIVFIAISGLIATPAPSRTKNPVAWTPKIEFQLDSADNTQALNWISGWAYAATEFGHAGSKSSAICLNKNQFVSSKDLLEALNKKYKNRRMSSEDASATLWTFMKSRYSCAH